MKVMQLQQEGVKRLEDAGIMDAVVDARYLLDAICGISSTQYYLRLQEEIEESLVNKYLETVDLRATHVPLQHIIGKQAFMGYEFVVNANVLSPRQDTERLVEIVEELSDGSSILDVCTGSGCIAISLEKRTHATVVGVDISPAALEVANTNKKLLHSKVTFIESDLFSNVTGRYQIIVSNPPYIAKNVIPTLMEEVREHEPILALDGGEDGLDFYRKIIKAAPMYLQAEGYLCFEIGYDQGLAVQALMEAQGFFACQIIKDYAQLDRVVIGQWKQND